MKPYIVTRQTKANQMAQWIAEDAQQGTAMRLLEEAPELYGEAKELGLTPDPDALEAVFRKASRPDWSPWTKFKFETPKCDGCDTDGHEKIMVVGEEENHDTATAHLCFPCLLEAYKLGFPKEARIAPHHPEDVVLVHPPPGDGSAFRAAAKVAATVCNPPQCPAVASDGTRCEMDAHKGKRHQCGDVYWFASAPKNVAESYVIPQSALTQPVDWEPPSDKCKHEIVKDYHDVAGNVQGKCTLCKETGFVIREAFWYDADNDKAVTDEFAARIVAVLGDKTTGDYRTELEVALDELVALRAEVAALKAEAQNPYVLQIPEDAPRFWAKECLHERTYRAEATVCRRCSCVVDPKPSLPAVTPSHPTLGLLPLECQRHSIYGQSPSDRAPDKCERCGYWTKL